MPQIDEPTSPAPQRESEVKKSRPAAAPRKPTGGLYCFTIDSAEGRIVMVERVDSDGTRHQLNVEQKASLAGLKAAMPMRRLVEQAFEAGIDFVLGDGAAEAQESKEDRELSSILVQTLIEGSKAKELVKSETLEKTIADTLIGHAAHGGQR